MKKIQYIVFAIVLTVAFSCGKKSENQAMDNKVRGLITEKAMVVSAHPLASQIGVNILKKGGNAVDAAIAVGFALAVVYPAAGNIGGGGFMLIRQANGEKYSIDYRERAPMKSYKNMFLDEVGNVIENLSVYGHLSAGIPGTVDGLVTAHKKYGTIPWQELLQPSIDLAKNGFVLTKKEARSLNNHREKFIQYNTLQPTNVLKDDMWAEGDTIFYPDLAETLTLIRDKGRSGFYEGKTAENIVKEMKRGKGIISLEDLKNYKSIWRTPISVSYKGYTITSMAPPSSGGIALIQLLKMVEPYSLKELGWHTPASIHLMAEAERRVYADRAKFLGDPDFVKIPLKGLQDSLYNIQRMKSFNPDSASSSKKVIEGNPYYIAESEETTHYSIIDSEGNAVSVTTTLNGGYGSHVFVAGSGFLLNNEMDDFSVKPGFANIYGLVGGEANAIQPYKTMLSSMTPTLVEQDQKLLMVVGTPGGATIITSVFQTIVNVLEHNMGMQEAVNAARFHHQWIPDIIFVEENTLSKEIKDKLMQMGHTLKEREKIGRVDAILILSDGKMEGGADTRGDDTALGF